MKYENVKHEIKAIADIADAVPEAFRARCFELLLQHFLDSFTSERIADKTLKSQTVNENQEDADLHKGGANLIASSVPTPSQIKVFMQKTGVTTDDLQRIVMFEDDEVHFVQEPTTQKIARGQIEWSLLIALKNGIAQNNLSVDPENVRSICQEKGFYDKANFSKTFKTPKNAMLFQGPMEAQGQAQKLTAEGQKELGKLVKELANIGS